MERSRVGSGSLVREGTSELRPAWREARSLTKVGAQGRHEQRLFWSPGDQDKLGMFGEHQEWTARTHCTAGDTIVSVRRALP